MTAVGAISPHTERVITEPTAMVYAGCPDAMPSYDELDNDYGKSPYCARYTRGETW